MTLSANIIGKDTAARVLVVDDDASIREMLTDLLTDMGCRADAAIDGEEAVEKVRREPFDLILLDLVLPKMSGQDAFETIREIDAGVPVIIATGYGSIESAVEFLKNGAVDYLTKPIHFEEFRFRINRALEEKRLKEQAITDLKTQLFNHNYFEKRLAEELGRAQRYGHGISLVMLDLDDFKDYNDTYGHLAGDQVLKQIGTILKEVTRDCDIPCRFGGEEFSVILPETDSAGAAIAAERIRSGIENHSLDTASPKDGKTVTASIGVCSYDSGDHPDNGYDMNSMIEQADKSLYEAKKAGKNRVRLTESPLSDISHG